MFIIENLNLDEKKTIKATYNLVVRMELGEVKTLRKKNLSLCLVKLWFHMVGQNLVALFSLSLCSLATWPQLWVQGWKCAVYHGN